MGLFLVEYRAFYHRLFTFWRLCNPTPWPDKKRASHWLQWNKKTSSC